MKFLLQKKVHIYIAYVFIFTGICSCMPIKQTTYLQDKSDNSNGKGNQNIEFDLNRNGFRLKPGDVLSVQINHIPLISGHNETEYDEKGINCQQ